MTISNFSGRHIAENIFHRCFSTYHPEAFSWIQDKLEKKSRSSVFTISLSSWDNFSCYKQRSHQGILRKGFAVRIDMDWSMRVESSEPKPAWGAACSPVSPQGLHSLYVMITLLSAWFLHFLSLLDFPLFSTPEPNYVWVYLMHKHRSEHKMGPLKLLFSLSVSVSRCLPWSSHCTKYNSSI